MYIILQQLTDDYFTVDKVRTRKVKTYEKAIEKVKALQVLDDKKTTYIITQKVNNE